MKTLISSFGMLAICLLQSPTLVAEVPASPQPGKTSDDSASTSSISPEELFQRVVDAGNTSFRTAVGGYVVRIYNSPDPQEGEKRKAQIAEVEMQVRAAHARRTERSRAVGVELDPAELERQLAQTMSEFESQTELGPVSTHIEKYYLEGQKFRIEKFSASNEESLETLRDQMQSGKFSSKSKDILVWDGTLSTEIKPKSPNSPPESTDIRLLHDQKPKTPEFMSYGRDANKNPDLLAALKAQNLPLSVEEVETANNEKALLLRAGAKDSIGFILEATIIPEKGYVVTNATVQMHGAVLARDIYRDFVKTDVGIWVPTNVMRETFQISQQNQVPTLSTRHELLAFDTPEVNVPIDSSLFEVSNDKSFRDLRKLRERTNASMVTNMGHDEVRLPKVAPRRRGLLPVLLGSSVVGLLLFSVMWKYRRQEIDGGVA